MNLDKIIEAKIKSILSEGDNEELPSGLLPNSSLDAKIDAFIMQYEDSASQEDLQELSLKSALSHIFEAEDDEEEAEEEPGGLDDMLDAAADEEPEAGNEEESEEEEPVEPVEEEKPELNIEVFAGKVARLVSNGTKLIDFESIILARVLNFVSENYDEKKSDVLRDVLMRDFKVMMPEDQEAKRDDIIAPLGKGAGPLSGGA